MGVRLGPRASGQSANYENSAPGTRQSPRKRSVRKMMNFLHAQGHIGFPPAMDADASSGFSSMGSRSAHVAINLRDVGDFALIRFAETGSRARATPESGTAQRAKAGYCACCTGATHAAIPPMYAPGAFDGLKSRGMVSRKAQRPRVPRRLAACSYAHANGQLSKNWDLAAQPLHTSAPKPLFRATPSATPLPLRENSPLPLLDTPRQRRRQ